jgi:hypothetical protein
VDITLVVLRGIASQYQENIMDKLRESEANSLVIMDELNELKV